MRSILVVGLLVVWGCAQPVGVAYGDEDLMLDVPTLSVFAVGRVDLKPDTAHVSLAVETAGKHFAQVQLENREKMQRVLEALGKFGIEPERIQTISFDVTPQYAPRGRGGTFESNNPQPPKIIGYTARNTLRVEVYDIEVVGKVVDLALSAGANRFSGIQWVLRDRHPVYLKALEKASHKALEKAKVLAKALGVSLVRLVQVQEGGGPVYPKRQPYAMRSMAMAEAGGDSVPVSPGEISVQATVSLVYDIE